jgi:hypothetical protein
MSQQQMFPEPQSNGQEAGSEDEIYYGQPYYWSVSPHNEAMPKDEPPSSYVESTIEHGYQAQDNAQNVNPGAYETNTGDAQFSNNGGQQQQFVPGGNANGQDYRSYNPYYGGRYWQGVPPYAQNSGSSGMRRRSPFRMIFFVLLLILLFRPILIVAGLLLASVGGALLFLLLMALFIFSMGLFRMALWPGYRRSRRYWYRRGPWW